MMKALFRDAEIFDNLFSSDLGFERERYLFYFLVDVLVLGKLSRSLKPKRFGSNRSGS